MTNQSTARQRCVEDFEMSASNDANVETVAGAASMTTEKRSKFPLGKRRAPRGRVQRFLGKRSESGWTRYADDSPPAWNDDDEADDDDVGDGFDGDVRRRSPKSKNPFLGKRVPANKRRNPFLGKRRNPFLGFVPLTSSQQQQPVADDFDIWIQFLRDENELDIDRMTPMRNEEPKRARFMLGK